jgi:hypothetical protein
MRNDALLKGEKHRMKFEISPFATALRDRAHDQGGTPTACEPDGRITEPEFSDIRDSLRGAVRFRISGSLQGGAGVQSGNLAIWETDSVDDALTLTGAFNDYLDRVDSDPLHFYVCGPNFILLDGGVGWDSGTEMEKFLHALAG